MYRIAVIEDSEANRLVLQVLLDGLYELTEYEDGIQALAGLTQGRPDLVLLDISLPYMSGLEVLRHIRAHPDLQALPVIVLTAHAMMGDRERFLAAGFDDYVSKPVDFSLLMSAIQRALVS